jgi:hypothetical protein
MAATTTQERTRYAVACMSWCRLSPCETLEATKPNARYELLPKAGATEERTLEAVSCSGLFGLAVPRCL